jgi:hypothetical protein
VLATSAAGKTTPHMLIFYNACHGPIIQRDYWSGESRQIISEWQKNKP